MPKTHVTTSQPCTCGAFSSEGFTLFTLAHTISTQGFGMIFGAKLAAQMGLPVSHETKHSYRVVLTLACDVCVRMCVCALHTLTCELSHSKRGIASMC